MLRSSFLNKYLTYDVEDYRRTRLINECSIFREDHHDFKNIVDSMGDDEVSFLLEHAILDAKNGPYVIYCLAKNKSEFDRINNLQTAEAVFLEVLNIDLSY